jgi:hypothetical protein
MNIATISTVIAAISVLVGVFFAVIQLRNVVKTRNLGLIIQLNPSFRVSYSEMVEAQSELMSLEYEDYDDFKKKYGELFSEGETQKAIGIMFSFFEGMGLLLHRRLIEISLVDWVTGGSGGVKMLWDKMKPVLEGFSQEYNIRAFQWTEYLYNELQKREQTLQQKINKHSLSFS